MTRVATPETEERLLAVGRAGTAEHVERIVRGWRRMDRKAEVREAARQHAAAHCTCIRDEDGTVVVRGRLAPEVGALLLKALAAARDALYQRTARPGLGSRGVRRRWSSSRPTRWRCSRRRPCTTAMDPGAPGERYQVVVHVDAAGAGRR